MCNSLYLWKWWFTYKNYKRKSCRQYQFSSVAQSCPILCNPMDCTMPGFPVHHQLPEPTQTHVHRVGDAIQPSYPLSSPSPPAFNLSQLRVFSNESVLHSRWPKYWSLSFSISPSNEYSVWFPLYLLCFGATVFLFLSWLVLVGNMFQGLPEKGHIE